MTSLDLDTRTKGTEGPFEHWEGDHTALVHVLWAAKHQGLTLEHDADAIASMVLRSRFLAAHTAQAIEAHGRAAELAARREAAGKEITNAERYERNAATARAELVHGGHHGEFADGLRLQAEKYERFADQARERAAHLLDNRP